MNRSSVLCAFAAACLVPLLTPSFAVAEEAEAKVEEAKAKVEEIVVTATKREENVQDVPIAVTALVNELKQPTVRTLVDLNGYAPNVRIDRDPSRSGGSSITIRGISPTRTDDNSFDAPIAVQLDGIYLGTIAGQIIENFDLERVEILRGPQGTLFGKNTTGGVVNVIRSRPTGEWGGRLKYDMGKWNQSEIRAVFNAPVIEDKLAAKVFYTNLQGDGYLVHTTPDIGGNNIPDNNHMPEQDYQNYGLTLLATPTDRFEALFTIEKFEDKSQGGGSLTNFNLAPGVAPKPPPGSPQTDLSGGFLSCTLFASHIIPQWDSTVPCRTSLSTAKSTSVDTRNPSNFDTDAYTLNTQFEINDHYKVVTVSGYRDMKEQRLLDFDGSSDNFITLSRDDDYDQKSLEARLEATYDHLTVVGGFHFWNSQFTQNWITGGEFWKYLGTTFGVDFTNNTWLSPTPPPISPLAACFAGAFGNIKCDTGASLSGLGDPFDQRLYEHQTTTSYAYFTQADWEFIENWTLTAGIRYTDEKKDFIAGQAYLASIARRNVDNYPGYAVLDNEWTKWTPKVGVSYKFSHDILFYTSYSEGFHSGGFFGVNQNIADFVRDQYKPEKIQSYEAGMKSQWFDNSLQLNVAGFYNKYKDKQESSVQFDSTTNTVATVFSNVADATYQGLELEAQWAASDNLNLFLSAGWLDATYDSFRTDINPSDDALPGGSQIVDASFLTPRNAPKYTYGVGGTYTYPIGPGNFQVFTKYSWVDKIETSLLNLDIGKVDARKDLSASIGYAYEKMSLTLSGNNLTDETFEVPFPIATLFASGTVTPGLSWTLTFSVDL